MRTHSTCVSDRKQPESEPAAMIWFLLSQQLNNYVQNIESSVVRLTLTGAETGKQNRISPFFMVLKPTQPMEHIFWYAAAGKKCAFNRATPTAGISGGGETATHLSIYQLCSLYYVPFLSIK